MSYGNAIAICYHLQFYTMIPHITIDNFFETPGLVRDLALRQEYFKGDRGTWPGLRSKFLHEIDHELFHIVCGKLMKHMPREFKDFKEIQIGFQLIDESWGSGWVHDDDKRHNMAGMIYLSPNPPIVDSGTSFYDPRMDDSDASYQQKFRKEMDDPEYKNAYEKDRLEHRNMWTESIKVQNRYNRCNIFDPRCWHSADNFFGIDKQTSRLTMVFFGYAL